VEPGWKKVREVIQRANVFVARAGALSLVFLMLLTAADVLGRDLFGRPVPGAVELSQYLLAVFILLGLAYTQQMKGHVTVSVLLSRIPVCGQFFLKLISSVLGLGLFGLLAWQGWAVGLEERTVSDLLRIPQSPFRILVAVAGFLVSLELLIDAGDALKGLVRRSS
jgi:TRAP-type C4-dicarboxylate transport system permease small subunit